MVVEALRKALSSGEAGLKAVPGLVVKVVDWQCWQHRYVGRIREDVRFNDFLKFIEDYPPEGLGATYDMLKRICKDTEAEDVLDKAVQGGRGGDRRSEGFKVDNVNFDSEEADGNSRAAALRRLRKYRPDLHAQVLEKKLSPHAAMVQAGFRPKTITVPFDVKKAAAVLVRNFKEDADRLIEAIQELL